MKYLKELVSIPKGSIKMLYKDGFDNDKLVSIPKGSIKILVSIDPIEPTHKFQFQKVQLKSTLTRVIKMP